MNPVSKVYTNIEFSSISEDRMAESWNKHFPRWENIPRLWIVLQENNLTSNAYKTASFKYQILIQKLEQMFKDDAIFMHWYTRIKWVPEAVSSCRADPCAVFAKLADDIRQVQNLRADVAAQCRIS